MRTHRLLAALASITLLACGAAQAQRPTGQSPVTVRPAPQSLDAALAAQGLRRFEPAIASRAMSHSFPEEAARAEGRHLTLHVSAGWNQSPPIFARRANGDVVLVEARPNVIVDRHLPGGCRGFLGGRAWFETVVYELPEGAHYEGPLTVSWDEHIEVVDWTDTQPDGSACPPPAID